MSVPGYVLPNDQPNIETSATHWTKPVEFNMKPQPEVYGIMHQARVHKLSSFFINTHGAKNVDVYITNESFGSNIPVKISPEQKINILKAEFTSHFIGVLKIEVVADEKQICTLLCEVFDPEQVKIETDQKVGTVGKTIQFGIKKADAGYAELLAVISDPAGHLLPREIYEVEGHQNVVTFKPNIEGTYKINISYGGEEILGSPFEYAIQNECETVHFASHDVRLKNIENQNDISRSSNIKPNIVKVVNKSVPNGKKYSNNQIYVRGLSSDIAEEEISEMFRAAGDIKISKKNGKEMILIYKDINGKKKGEATVTFYHPKAALLAVEKFNGMQYKRRTLEVSMSIINMTPGPQSCTNNDFSLPQNVENLTVVKEVNENSNEDVTSKEERWMMSDKTVPPIDLKLEQEVLWKCNQVNCKIDGFTSLEQLKSHLKFHYLSPSDVHAIDSEPKQISRMIFKDSSNDVIKGRGPFTFASTNEYLTKEYECLEDLCRMTFDTEQHLLNHIYQFHRSEPHTKQSSNSNDKFSTLDALNRGKKSLKWHSALEQHKQIWWRCNQPNCNFFGCNNARKMQIHLAHHKLSSKEIIKFAEDETAMNTHLTKIVRTVYKDGSQKRIGCGSSSMTSNNKAIQEFTCEAEENCDFICKLEYEILDHWNRIHPCVVKDKQRTAKLVTEEGTKWKCMNMNCEQVIYCLPGSLKLAEHWIASHSAIDLSTLSFREMSTNQVMNIEKIYGHISACGEMDCGFIATSHLSLNEVIMRLYFDQNAVLDLSSIKIQ